MPTAEQITLDGAIEPPYEQEVQLIVVFTLSLSTNNSKQKYLDWARKRLLAADPFYKERGAAPEILSIEEEHEIYSQNDGHEQDYKDARAAEAARSRMKHGLPAIPDPVLGDLVTIASQRMYIDELLKTIREQGWIRSPDRMGG